MATQTELFYQLGSPQVWPRVRFVEASPDCRLCPRFFGSGCTRLGRSLLLRKDLLLHGSEANDSDRRRCGLTLRYSSADVQAHLNWNRKGVIVSGTADPARWPGAQRPETD